MSVFAQRQRQWQHQHSLRSISPYRISNLNADCKNFSRARQPVWGNQALQRQLRAQGLQTKPIFNRTEDKYEQEADRTADEIMRRPDAAFPDTITDGQPLSTSSRTFFEAYFDQDFRCVRLHAGPAAAQAAEAVNAKAFTVGRDIVFGKGSYAPQTPAGRRLMAHELTHVVQQSASGTLGGAVLQRRKNDSGPDEPSLQSRVNFIVDELFILKPKNAWNGINEKYKELESMGPEAFEILSATRSTAEVAAIHDLGAAAADALGNTQLYWERRQREKNLLAADIGHIDDKRLKQLLDILSNTNSQFSAVRIEPRSEPKSKRKRDRLQGPELVQVQSSLNSNSGFDPRNRRSITFAAEKIGSTGYFEGLVPAGAYRLGDQEFTVTAGTKITDTR
jgi:hypothetical protein